MTCRICYEEEVDVANPLLRPCACKGSSADLHLQCLRHWMQVSTRDTCEICKVPYHAEELILEKTAAPCLQTISSQTQSVFYSLLMAYVLYVLYDHNKGPIGLLTSSIINMSEYMRIHTTTIEAVPYLMLLIMAIQVQVLVSATFLSLALHVLSDYARIRVAILKIIPYLMIIMIGIQVGFMGSAIYIIRDKRRYGRYLCASNWTALYLFLTIGSSVMTVWFPFVGALASTCLMSRLHEIHHRIVTRINRDITGVV